MAQAQLARLDVSSLNFGDNVRLRNGKVCLVEESNTSEPPSIRVNGCWYRANGVMSTDNPNLENDDDIVAVLETPRFDSVSLECLAVGSKVRLYTGDVLTLKSIKSASEQYSYVFKCPDGRLESYTKDGIFSKLTPYSALNVAEILPNESVDLSEFNLQPGIKAVTRNGVLLTYKEVYVGDHRLTEWVSENTGEDRLYWNDGQRYSRRTKDDIVELLAPLTPNANV